MPRNRLADEVSPYLLQHADNPVHWWPWGEAAFAEARRRHVPVLLSIGYSACHWCHVMAHESFEDPDTAALMNELYVNVKVDREERTDVDQFYMAALHAFGQHGGWPMTMFLAPEGRPFWGGTYFPKTARYGQPAFAQVLRSVARHFATDPATVAGNGQAIIHALGQPTDQTPARIDTDRLAAIARAITRHFDPKNGGLNGAPKFPNPPVLDFLCRIADRTGDATLSDTVTLTLERMTRGGIHDHIGGGFARYAVDQRWLVPHFEKMLYDNAQLLPLIALVGRRTHSAFLIEAARRIVEWLEREMLTPSGAFAASLDADSPTPDGHLEEGAFYVWTPDDITRVLGAEAAAFCADYDITPYGNFEGACIPNRLAGRGLQDNVPFRQADALKSLLTARAARPPAARDDKILADWNGMMIVGLVRAGMILGESTWTALARRAYDGVCACLARAGTLGHASRAGRAVHPGYASDLAAMALAALTLAETDRDPGLLADARRWLDDLLARYRLPSGILALAPADQPGLPLRLASTQDDATPNPNALAFEALVRLAAMTGETAYAEAADALATALSGAVLDNPYGHAATLAAFDFRLNRQDIVIAGPTADDLLAAALARPHHTRSIRRLAPDQPLPAVFAGLTATRPIALVCTPTHCLAPAYTVADLADRLPLDTTW
jgi:uncharacterized protein YyaL (SSP411 family)